MTQIWTETGFAESDAWVVETDEVKAGEGQRAIVSLDDFLTRAAESNESGFGVIVRPADDVTRLQPYIDRIGLVAVEFAAFNDGRGYSHASLLRSRLTYRGALRAVGDVLIDSIPLMLRCGFDSFAVTNATAIRRLSEGRLPGIDQHYQPAARPAANPGSYAWRRKDTGTI